jgi:hypothetical protein
VAVMRSAWHVPRGCLARGDADLTRACDLDPTQDPWVASIEGRSLTSDCSVVRGLLTHKRPAAGEAVVSLETFASDIWSGSGCRKCLGGGISHGRDKAFHSARKN